MKNKPYLLAGNKKLALGKRAYVMGILNVTPDSFYDGGQYDVLDEAVARAVAMEKEGADIIDIGGESTRPGHSSVSDKEEIRRVLPVIEALAETSQCVLSIDTSKAAVAEAAVLAGATMINDVWGCQNDAAVAKIAAKSGAALVLMSNATRKDRMKKTDDPVADSLAFLKKSLAIAHDYGVLPEQLVLDPGIGFGIDHDASMQMIARLARLSVLGYPILLGPSRKRFIWAASGADIEDRLPGTLSAVSIGAFLGADILRVHDVGACRQALDVAYAIRQNRQIFATGHIKLIDMRFDALIGDLPEERTSRQKIAVDLVLYCMPQTAGETDLLDDTVDYAKVTMAVESVIRTSSPHLLERLSEMILEGVFACDDRIVKIDLEVRKLSLPIATSMAHVAYSLSKVRAGMEVYRFA